MKVYMLLDASGSMSDNWAETLGAINKFVASEQKTAITGLTLIAHDYGSSMNYRVLRDDVKLHAWKPVTTNEVSPGGYTPLYDAMGKLLTTVIDVNPEQGIVVVITDGQENSSREWNAASVSKLMDILKNKKVEFTFIGADFNAFGQAGSVGVSSAYTLNMTKGNYAETFRSLRSKTEVYATSAPDMKAAAMMYSAKDRAVAEGKVTGNLS